MQEIQKHKPGKSSGEVLFYNRDEPYFDFTNFADYPILLDDEKWPTTQHYFQAQKFIGTPYLKYISTLQTPRDAFSLSRQSQVSQWLRGDWEQVKQDVMYKALLAKFSQHSELRDMLLGTGDRKLVEHTRNDRYWGDGGDGSGQNHLGRLLMKVRSELQKDAVEHQPGTPMHTSDTDAQNRINQSSESSITAGSNGTSDLNTSNVAPNLNTSNGVPNANEQFPQSLLLLNKNPPKEPCDAIASSDAAASNDSPNTNEQLCTTSNCIDTPNQSPDTDGQPNTRGSIGSLDVVESLETNVSSESFYVPTSSDACALNKPTNTDEQLSHINTSTGPLLINSPVHANASNELTDVNGSLNGSLDTNSSAAPGPDASNPSSEYDCLSNTNAPKDSFNAAASNESLNTNEQLCTRFLDGAPSTNLSYGLLGAPSTNERSPSEFLGGSGYTRSLCASSESAEEQPDRNEHTFGTQMEDLEDDFISSEDSAKQAATKEDVGCVIKESTSKEDVGCVIKESTSKEDVGCVIKESTSNGLCVHLDAANGVSVHDVICNLEVQPIASNPENHAIKLKGQIKLSISITPDCLKNLLDHPKDVEVKLHISKNFDV